MKIWQGGLLVAGVALTGVLAVRLAEPPVAIQPIPRPHTPEIAVPLPARSIPAAPPVRWTPALAEEAASAPPAIYTQPPPPAPLPVLPKTVKRRPFPEPVKEVATPALRPAPYVEPPKPARHVTLETGLGIEVRLTNGNAVLEKRVVVEGLEIAEKGATANVRAGEGNKFQLLSFQSADGQRVEVITEPVSNTG